jgi:hypothetical protein
MNSSPSYTITSETAVDLIRQGKPVRNCHITGDLEIYKLEKGWDAELILENCTVNNMVAPGAAFQRAVRLVNCRFYKCSFNYAYFQGGLTIDNCIFETYLDFEAGGHNEIQHSFQILNSHFRDFVNFFDCWFKGEVVIADNDFEGGTNLLGNKMAAFSAQFDIQPRIENNKGPLDLDGEGAKTINTIDLR